MAEDKWEGQKRKDRKIQSWFKKINFTEDSEGVETRTEAEIDCRQIRHFNNTGDRGRRKAES